MPDLDALSAELENDASGQGGETSSDGSVTGGGSTGGAAAGGSSDAGAADGGQGGAEGGGAQGGENGQAGAAQGGDGGVAQSGEGGMGDMGAGGDLQGGAGGMSPVGLCADGCALLYVPFDSSTGSSQYFTINLNIANGVDLSQSVLTAHLRNAGSEPTTASIQIYASAIPSYAFYGAQSLPVSSLDGGGTLTLDLTNTGAWDNTKVISFGFLIQAGGSPVPVSILIEEVLITNTDTYGPWLFTQASDVNDESVAASFNDPDIIFANAYNRIEGAKATWVAASSGAGSAGGAL